MRKIRKRNASNAGIFKLTMLAMLTALVAILAYVGSFIRLSPMVTVSLTLIPIVIGAVMFGMSGGSWLGLVSALVILFSGQAAGFMVTPALTIGTIVIVVAKGVLSGLFAAVFYRLFSKRNRYVGIIVAAVISPIVNTGIYLLGCVTLFSETIKVWISMEEETVSMFTYLFFSMGLINFPFELLFNIVLCPVIYRIIKIIPNRAME